MSYFLETKMITRQTAQLLVDEAIKKAEELGININVAVVDNGGHLISFARMDHAPILSTEIAINKAYTSVAFGLPTHEWYPIIKDQPALREGIVHTSRLVIFGGGFPIKWADQELIGGIGVSGGSAEQDMACAQAGLALLDSLV